MSTLSALRRIVEAIRVRFHDEYTICEYFRSQGASIGQGCRILTRSLGSEPYLVSIGQETLVSSEVLFVTHDGATWVGRKQDPALNHFGRVVVGDRCFVGARSILLPGTRIGDGSVVGAGAICKGIYPAGSVVAGVPARVIGTTEEYLERARAASISLPPEVLPLDQGDRELLRRILEKAVPDLDSRPGSAAPVKAR